MKKQQIQDLFNERYNQATWKQFLGQAFANVQLLSTPENLTGIDHNVAANAQKLGYILLNEDGIERQIAVYEVTLADGIILERNRVGLRNLLRKFWKNIDAAFIVYHHPESVNWRFTYVSELTGYDAEGEFIQIKTEPKRYTYILGEGESIRTAVERFERIINKGNKVSLEDVKEAFSVEKLSKTFFEKYKEHYNNFCEYIISQPGISQTIFNGDEKAIRDFSKKLLGRIVFLYFIQKKGWLGVPENEDWGKGDHHFLTNQFQSFPHKELFYLEFLSVLFFDTLNTKRPNDLIELVKNQPYRIPYLNGGLFEEDNSNHRNLIFPDHLFANLFNSFDQYNFTIYEDDPLDHTIAVDPEMLGHIFENLLEDNKDKGAYYTPKEIVHYMCQESLIEYLNTYCLNCDFSDLGITLIEETQKELITQFIKKKEINIGILEKSSKSKESSKSWFRHLNIALDNVKICDPAIGSGAFPMGLLHEIFTAKQTLHTFEFGNTTNFNASGVKLNIIQNSIYGVDIERGAVDIARLRFWLSLIVDEPKPKALPNLDYKIVVGNSLVSKFGDDIIDIDWEMKDAKQGSLLVDVYQPDEILRKISEKQKQFFSPDSDKKTLAADIRDLKIDLLISQLELMIKTKGMETKPTGTGKTLTKNTEIYLQTVGWKQNIKELKALKNKSDESLNFFDWKLDFPEVMNQQVVENVGFDIVIGNPPYGAKLSALDIKFFKEKYQIKTSETAILFIERGISLNKENGIKTYIIPKSFTFASNYSDIRDFVQKEIALIADCGKAFENVKLEACIISIHKGKIIDNYKSILFKADKSFDFMGNIHKKLKIKFGLFPNGINNSELIIGDKIFEKSDFLNNIANNSRGEIGLQKHLVTEGKYAVIGGKEINKYRIRNIKGYINDVNSISEKAKINKNSVLVQNIVAHITKPYEHIQIISCIPEKTDLILVDTINQITIKENAISSKYIWCLLNSKLVNWYTYLFIFGKAIRTMHFDSPVTSRIPIMLSCENIQNIFIKKSEEIISLKSSGKDTTALEQQIDNIVYKLYELTYEEVKIIDPEFALTEQEYADIKLEGV
ncbi:N-6 DNA methylase [Dolichospermum sp. ST_con]|nr:N-6 DNA methylase [Dolichospermum sp. ST_con]MDD1420164.1 N-6 DNA methylase [Dolichospermum sp. ST_sed1]MDD1425872.1 N-6 DNA methylase [Dolichospermum sp. ST_sed9]MDD1434306.1 N-6 DNA methylase [Dolichospermum sp. ST_sed6]MDD1435958.1 N-6 DNA methylase [Dolichospermum sp. ST_sed10]MDD1441695.1 N-6 DNA methylase [Dolichospermum sp. ST_sed3]MDD1457242.1 N-6 DNA methylase [Dolichospermum sp. ST_sed7]MDD1461605.1 N-6 DNA methylase [Dolichospermum sp. ST_sed2]MDD1465434.1 N-6 DNA methylase [D